MHIVFLVLAVLAYLVLVFFSSVFAVETIWNWHIAQAVGFQMTWRSSVGVALLAGLLLSGVAATSSKDSESSGGGLAVMGGGLLAPWLSVFIAWLFT